jgi:hypothetical protein
MHPSTQATRANAPAGLTPRTPIDPLDLKRGPVHTGGGRRQQQRLDCFIPRSLKRDPHFRRSFSARDPFAASGSICVCIRKDEPGFTFGKV